MLKLILRKNIQSLKMKKKKEEKVRHNNLLSFACS